MKESATIALAYLKAHAAVFQIDPEVFSKWNVHIHVPEGAIVKTGLLQALQCLLHLLLHLHNGKSGENGNDRRSH